MGRTPSSRGGSGSYFAAYLDRWQLTVDGVCIRTAGSRLLPVRRGGRAGMLKIALHGEERRGAAAMRGWPDDAVAPVWAQEGRALLLARAIGTRSLLAMATQGRDDEASAILCATAARLHASPAVPPESFVPLACWFAALPAAASRHGGVFAQGASIADALLAAPRDATALHGDLHHGNVLDFGSDGWRAIDPKALIGERGFDYAQIFCNPELGQVRDRARLRRQLDVVAPLARIERDRLLAWIVAYACLSAAWMLDDGGPVEAQLAVAEDALAVRAAS